MKALTACLLVLATFVAVEGLFNPFRFVKREPPPPKMDPRADLRAVSTKYSTRMLDNFNPDPQNRTFKMRYMVNDQYHKDNGPIFIMLGGEWEINLSFLVGGHMYEIGRDLGAYLVYTEHRYYGQTKPTPDTTTENLQWLNVDQALKDVVEVVKEIKQEKQFAKSKVIVFGGSYAGNMATWIRLKYPEIIDGAVASSGPVLAKANFYEYLETVGNSMKTYGGQTCYDTIAEGVKEAQELLKTFEGADEVSRMFKLCKTLNIYEPLDVQSFYSLITESYSGVVQYGTPSQLTYYCRVMETGGSTPLEKVATFVKTVSGGVGCVDIQYDNMVEYFSDTSYTDGEDHTMRLWIYQTCNEYGYYQTTESKNQPFGSTFPLTFYTENFCPDVYGEKFGTESVNKGVAYINKQYGGLKPKVTNVFSVHGSIDPWHRLGVVQDLSENSPAILVNGTSHCKDLQASSASDNPEMTEARARVREHVTKWVM